ncbi:MAG TPA: flagellin [Solirubrobacteraceae bacterium]|nr:flagellin [Solirubrobacteraceae bacterium]
MGLRIQNNIEAFNAHRNLTSTAAKAAQSMEKLSSGYRINRAADDAAGLAISEKMRSQIGGLAQAQRNAQDGVSLVQTAEGSLNEVHSMLQRMRDLKVQYANGTLSTDDKSAIVAEGKQLAQEIGNIQSTTKFNGISLLDGAGGTSGAISFQVGANSGETISVTTKDILGTNGVGTNIAALSGSSASSTTWDSVSLTDIDDAIKNVSSLRGDFGAVQNRLDHRLNNLATYQENLTASESRIRDVDMASEMTEYTKLNILQQAGTSMLAQANQAPQNVLSLLR